MGSGHCKSVMRKSFLWITREKALISCAFIMMVILAYEIYRQLKYDKTAQRLKKMYFLLICLIEALGKTCSLTTSVVVIHYGLIENVTVKSLIAVGQSVIEYVLFFYTCYYFAIQGKYFFTDASFCSRVGIRVFFILDVVVIAGIGLAVFIENINTDPDKSTFC